MNTSFIRNIEDIVEVGSEEQQPQETTTTATTEQPSGNAAPPPDEIKETKKVTAELARASSSFFVKMIDGGQSLLLSALTNRKLKNRLQIIAGDDYEFQTQMAREKLDADEENLEKGNPTTHQYTQQEKMLLGNVIKFENFIDTLPFTETEKEDLIESLSIIAKEKGGTLPPEYIVAGTVLLTIGKRANQLYGL